jgi:hypothetical protein
MDETVRFVLVYVVFPLVSGLGAFFVKSMINRVDTLEKAAPKKLEATDVKELLSYQLDPIREDIRELKTQVSKIVDMLMNGRK